MTDDSSTCPKCSGIGYLVSMVGESECSMCNGSGTVSDSTLQQWYTNQLNSLSAHNRRVIFESFQLGEKPMSSDDEDDPHAHLPGDLRDPKLWVPKNGQLVMCWWTPSPEQFYVGRYDAMTEDVCPLYGQPDLGDTLRWESLIAARPAILRPEKENEGGD